MKPGLGKIQPGGAVGSKDAFHCPVVMAYSKEVLTPGQAVRFTDQTLTKVAYADGTKHGIVDPFIEANDIQPGFPFWVLLTPDSIHNLSHKFDVVLPDIPEVEEQKIGIKSSLLDYVTSLKATSQGWVSPHEAAAAAGDAEPADPYNGQSEQSECKTMGCD